MKVRDRYVKCFNMALIAAIALSAGGCAEYQVRVPDEDPLHQEYTNACMHALFWGRVIKPEVMTADCKKTGINDVIVVNNYLYDLAGVVTLGIWMPIEVRYRCKAPPIDGGKFPVPGGHQ